MRFYWLPVEQRIIFKVLLFTFKVVNGLSPSYLSELLDSNEYVKIVYAVAVAWAQI